MKPIADVIREIDATRAVYRFFVDDNITLNSDYAREVFKALARKRIYWGSQISPTVLKNPDLIDLAAKAGCQYFLIGLESIDMSSLKGVKKEFNQIDQYEELIARMYKVRITPLPLFMFGFEESTPDEFRLTLEFLKRNRIRIAIFWILTPYPGTEIFDRIKKEGRLEHTNWSQYDASHVVFRPRNYTKIELNESLWKAYQDFYSYGRLFDFALNSRFRSLLPNLGTFWILRRKVFSYEHPFSFGYGRLN